MQPLVEPGQRRIIRGFTLIELLVVIAIIALLAAILFPVFARARENARRASCQSNLKQMALGIKQYAQDYDETFPENMFSGAAPYQGWVTKMDPYMKSLQIFQCPSQNNQDSTYVAVDSWGMSDYYFNSNLGTYENGSNCPNGKFLVKEALVDSTSNVILFGDTGRSGEYAYANCPYNATCDGTRPNSASAPGWGRSVTDINAWSTATDDVAARSRHLEGTNIAFVDGHVKWYRPEKQTFDNPSTGNVTFKINDTNGGLSATQGGCKP